MKPLIFDSEKHRYARLKNGTIQSLYEDGTEESRNFYEDEDGKWYMELDESIHPKMFRFCNTRHRIIEFLKEKE